MIYQDEITKSMHHALLPTSRRENKSPRSAPKLFHAATLVKTYLPLAAVFFVAIWLSFSVKLFATKQKPPLRSQPSATKKNANLPGPASFAEVIAAAVPLQKRKAFVKSSDSVVFILTMRPAQMACVTMTLLSRNFISSNPADVFIFSVVAKEKKKHVAALAACLDPLPRFHLVDMLEHPEDLGWVTPRNVRDRTLWLDEWSEDVRRMGHWRLTSQFQLARDLGYKYLLQVDDDSEFPSLVRENLFDTMRRDHLKIAGRGILPDEYFVARGLPELARYFLVTEQIEPSPSLFKHCDPPSMDGLFSSVDGEDNAGWDRTSFYGNFVIYSLDFVYEPIVQRFINLVLQTGAHFRFRWNEQATLGMVWHMFVREGEYKVFDFPYRHQDFTG